MRRVGQIVRSTRMICQPWSLIGSVVEYNVTDGEHPPLRPHAVYHLLHLVIGSLATARGEGGIEAMLVSQGVGRSRGSQGLQEYPCYWVAVRGMAASTCMGVKWIML